MLKNYPVSQLFNCATVHKITSTQITGTDASKGENDRSHQGWRIVYLRPARGAAGMGGEGVEGRGPGMGGEGVEGRGPGMGGEGVEGRGPGMGGEGVEGRGPGMGGEGVEGRGPGMGGEGVEGGWLGMGALPFDRLAGDLPLHL